jgi:hypothetical protein
MLLAGCQSLAVVLKFAGAYSDTGDTWFGPMKAQTAHVALAATQPVSAEITLIIDQLIGLQRLKNLSQNRNLHVFRLR